MSPPPRPQPERERDEDLGWWQGRVDARLDDLNRRITEREAADHKNGHALNQVNVELARVSTRVGLLIGVCTAVGGGAVALAVYFITSGGTG